MGEIIDPSETREALLPNQILLLSEPVFKTTGMDEGPRSKFTVPIGVERWVGQFSSDGLTDQMITKGLINEYISIANSLRIMRIPFRVIVAHRQNMDERLTLAILREFNVRGLALDRSISETCFPRDMLVDFDGDVHINPDANFFFPDNSGTISPLGVGGRVLKLDEKVFVPDPRGFVKTRKEYDEGINRLSDRFQFGFLPHPLAAEIDLLSNTRTIFPSDHLDRVASLIRGKDGRGYLLLDSNYVSSSQIPYGSYWKCIKEACKALEISPVVIDRELGSIPYALNLEQFANGNVLLTGGDAQLAKIVGEIVGEDKVCVTEVPIIFYPLYRNGAIRCMLLKAPKRIVGGPLITST